MPLTKAATRALSATLFGNEKMAEVIFVLATESPATAQEISKKTGISYPLARDVLLRLQKGGLLTSARTGGSRSPLLYDPVDEAYWHAAVALARAILDA
jgi:predicted ArsR family transcriptional regulator